MSEYMVYRCDECSEYREEDPSFLISDDEDGEYCARCTRKRETAPQGAEQ